MKNYFNLISDIESDVAIELVELLKARGKGVSDEDEYIEFFGLDSIGQLGITEIDVDGQVVGGSYDGSSMRSLVNDGVVLLLDVITLVNELRDITKVTALDVMNWHGSEHNIEELAEYLADVINGDISIETAREDIGSCRIDEDEEDE